MSRTKQGYGKVKMCHMELGWTVEEIRKWITKQTTVTMFHVRNHLLFSVWWAVAEEETSHHAFCSIRHVKWCQRCIFHGDSWKGLGCELSTSFSLFLLFHAKAEKKRKPAAPRETLQFYLDGSICRSDRPLWEFLVFHGPENIIELKGEEVH